MVPNSWAKMEGTLFLMVQSVCLLQHYSDILQCWLHRVPWYPAPCYAVQWSEPLRMDSHYALFHKETFPRILEVTWSVDSYFLIILKKNVLVFRLILLQRFIGLVELIAKETFKNDALATRSWNGFRMLENILRKLNFLINSWSLF